MVSQTSLSQPQQNQTLEKDTFLKGRIFKQIIKHISETHVCFEHMSEIVKENMCVFCLLSCSFLLLLLIS